jgi:glycosyltransferase involved in cell wall biosynthesis
MKLAFVTTYDSRDISAWSGTPYFMAESLKEHYQSIYYVGLLKTRWNRIFQAKSMLYQVLFNKVYFRDRQPAILRSYARQVKGRLSQVDVDVVFSPGTIPIAYLEYNRPIAFWADATFAGMMGFYWNHLCKQTVRDGNAMEQAALSRCSLAIYASDWAAQTAIDNYEVERSKIKIVPFGANMECNRSIEDIKQISKKRLSDRCKLIFVGKDWIRKGGDTAIQVAEKLNEIGLPTELIVVGVGPNVVGEVPPFVKFAGSLDKSNTDAKRLLDSLYSQSHFLILPSRAECLGIVLAEANSFGVPCITSRAGGIPTMIKDGVNGMSFDVGSPIEEYCSYIHDMFLHYAKYQDLAVSAFNEYKSRLNWEVAVGRVAGLLQGL